MRKPDVSWAINSYFSEILVADGPIEGFSAIAGKCDNPVTKLPLLCDENSGEFVTLRGT